MTVPRVGFVLEQTLGHITHTDNLRRLIPAHDTVAATFLPVEFALDGVGRHVPGYGNWTVRSGLRARQAIRHAGGAGAFDALFIHTQVPAVLLPDVVARVPTVVSLDATPKQYDSLGDHYAHATGGRRVEQFKAWANRRCFERARHVVTWARWTKEGLADEYGVDPSRITVIPPGVDPSVWAPPAMRDPIAGAPVRILFVGGDLARKGGLELVEAFRTLRADPALGPIELHLVTRSAVTPEPGLVVHSSMQPNSAELVELYHSCDVFCLPTHGDCLPMVLSEAGAARLPVVSTDVGAIGEIVLESETGYLVTPGDVAALADRLRRLVIDPELRRRLGARAADVVDERFDAAKNAAALVELLIDVAERDRR
jgi:glycosyltransferase involved in cell wall biosynthesis